MESYSLRFQPPSSSYAIESLLIRRDASLLYSVRLADEKMILPDRFNMIVPISAACVYCPSTQRTSPDGIFVKERLSLIDFFQKNSTGTNSAPRRLIWQQRGKVSLTSFFEVAKPWVIPKKKRQAHTLALVVIAISV